MVFPIKGGTKPIHGLCLAVLQALRHQDRRDHAFVRPDIEDGVLMLNLGELITIGGWTRKKKP